MDLGHLRVVLDALDRPFTGLGRPRSHCSAARSPLGHLLRIRCDQAALEAVDELRRVHAEDTPHAPGGNRAGRATAAQRVGRIEDARQSERRQGGAVAQVAEQVARDDRPRGWRDFPAGVFYVHAEVIPHFDKHWPVTRADHRVHG